LMRQSKVLETWVGLFVALGLVGLFFLAMKVSNLADLQVRDDSYRLFARFQNVGSLRVRSPVSMAGVRVGRVSAIRFDNKNYEAVVEMRIEPDYKTIPTDTTANILTAGLLGEQYVGLSAGGDEEFLKDGDEIELSQSAMVLEEIISRFLFNKAESGTEKKDTSSQNTTEQKAEPETRAAEDALAKPKPMAKIQEKSAINKDKPLSLPKVEKAEAEPASKSKASKAKPTQDAHAGQKAKGAAVKSGEDRDADHKNKLGAR
jgi:phospholipid/cholesterol/gamma-HCH transport system substrate-binding protein